MYQEYKSYFKNTEDENAYFFDITSSPYDSFFYSESRVFGEGKQKIHIIDQFNGKRPALLSNKFLKDSELHLGFYCSIILDSNVVNLLHKYVTNNERMLDEHCLVTKSFLNHIVKIKSCDYNPIFYVIESYLKSEENNFLKHASDALTSILKLHSMYPDEFIENGTILINEEAKNYYFKKYNANNFETCGRNWARNITKDIEKKEYNYKINLSYVSLLKMVLIKFGSSNSPYKKIEDFETFMISKLGIHLSREFILAAHYFSNLAGKFVNTQSNMLIANAIHDLKATAWDLFLLRLPDMLLTPNHLPEINVAYVATCEVELYKFGELFDIHSVACRTDNNRANIPLLISDISKIEKKITSKKFIELLKKSEDRFSKQISQQSVESIKPCDLDWLIEELEGQLSNLCRKN